MNDLLQILLAGGGTGVLGTVLSAGLSVFERMQRNKHQLQLRKVDLEIIAAEAKTADRRHEQEIEVRTLTAENEALIASYKHASTTTIDSRLLTPAQTWVMVVGDVTCMLTRPVLTFGSTALVAYIYLGATGLAAENIVSSIIYVNTTAVTWWFADRTRQKLFKQK